MMLKYESELLFDLMKREEESSSSDVLPYETELKEKYLNQVVGAYPKLQDYRPEWLYYNLYHYLPSYFPVESVANVTSASFYNVVPYAYKSAILTGQTLVNLINDGEVTKNATNNWVVFSADFNADMIKTSTDYTLITYVISNTLSEGTGCVFGVSGGINDGFEFNAITVPSGQTGIYKIKLKTKNVFSQPPVLRQQIFNDVATGSITFKQVLVEGDYTNVDVPYFEGMQSVKLPVLTTTGKNLWRYGELGEFGVKIVEVNIPKGTYFFSGEPTMTYEQEPVVRLSDATKQKLVHGYINSAITADFDIAEVVFYSNGYSYTDSTDKLLTLNNFMMEQGDKHSSYEPYKTNILTVNEPIELRGIGNGSSRVEDELNLLTGELTQRIGEVEMNGSESWLSNTHYPPSNNELVRYDTIINYKNTSLLCDNYDVLALNNNGDYEGIRAHNGLSLISLYINKNKLTSTTINDYLKNNPFAVQYSLPTESIKTVELSCINEQVESTTFRPIEGTMHVNTSSQALPPLLDMSVPIEATTQNLMSFSNISEEE